VTTISSEVKLGTRRGWGSEAERSAAPLRTVKLRCQRAGDERRCTFADIHIRVPGQAISAIANVIHDHDECRIEVNLKRETGKMNVISRAIWPCDLSKPNREI